MKNIICSLSFTALIAPQLSATVIAGLGATYSVTELDGDISDTSLVLSYTNSVDTFTDLVGANAVTNASTGSSYERVYWGNLGTKIADPATSMTGIDMGHGVIDLDSADFQFGGLVGDGIDTNGNDIVLFELGTLDAGTTIYPLDNLGNVIGDFSLSLGTAAWGVTDTRVVFDLVTNTGVDAGPYAGFVNIVGFDVSDFSGTGELTGMTGIRITNSDSLDLGVAAATIIPEPGAYALMAGFASFVGILLYRRRR